MVATARRPKPLIAPGGAGDDSVAGMALPIEDYAVIGDTATAALVGSDGSVDWLCLPRFDSPACFAALLGDPDNGRWLIGPEGEYTSSRRYLGNTAVLESTYTTDTGEVRVVDVMPVADQRADIVRRVVGVSGTVGMRHEWVVRPGYGQIMPWVTRQRVQGQPVIVAIAGPDKLVLRGSLLPEPVDGRYRDRFDVSEGEELTFATTWIPSHRDVPELLEFDARIEATIARSERWASYCSYRGHYREAVLRSLITLRLMTHGGTGGIVAAPTTSLPEDFGGVRNWDYRFCWLRDASLTLEALLACGYSVEARLWRDWLLRAVAGDPRDLQIMYAVDGGRDLPERELDHLAGYAGSRPVRVGNGAVTQRQSDVLGEVMIALEMAREMCVPESEDSWTLQRVLVDHLAEHWDQPDNGLWEIRGPRRHFTHSRVMVWVAFDRAVRAVEQHGFDGPVERWRGLRDEVREEILTRGYDARRNTFTQHYDTTEVDASLLVLPLVGFVDGDDPRMLGTIEAVEKDLMQDGLLYRYRTETGVDGLPGDEHPFVACSFWLVSAYAKAGRVDDAHVLMRRMLGLLNDLGLASEEYDPVAERMAGNFPQAFSHLALVGAAVHLAEADPGEPDPEADPAETTSADTGRSDTGRPGRVRVGLRDAPGPDGGDPVAAIVDVGTGEPTGYRWSGRP
jgi:GH15 family glucan-1,4-alpha-glucosidase